ncbi:MAG TPA: DUF4386 family protein [Coriobacteriia bacterium]|nr:DUF4386 family protein [Coriobacteriia bacterium]
MNALTQDEARRQKAGGAAALYISLALIAAMPFFLLLVDYQSATTAAQKVAVVVANYASLYAMYLASYVFYGLAVGVLAFALHDRMAPGAPALMRAATAVGLIWSVTLIASGMVWNYGMTTVVSLAKTSPAQAQLVWHAMEPMSEALGGAGGELLGGLWILLLSVVALRTAALPKALGWFGVIMALAGLTSVVPPLHDAAILFGLAMIVWCAWLGIVMLRTKSMAPVAAAHPARTTSAASTSLEDVATSPVSFG